MVVGGFAFKLAKERKKQHSSEMESNQNYSLSLSKSPGENVNGIWFAWHKTYAHANHTHTTKLQKCHSLSFIEFYSVFMFSHQSKNFFLRHRFTFNGTTTYSWYRWYIYVRIHEILNVKISQDALFDGISTYCRANQQNTEKSERWRDEDVFKQP